MRRLRWVAVAMALAVAVLLGGRSGILTESRSLTAGIAIAFAAMALSLNIVMGYANRLSLAHASFAGIGAFASGIITARGAQLPFVAGIAGAALAGGIAGSALGLVARRLRGVWLALVTLAFAVAMDRSIFVWDVLTGPGGLEVRRPRIGSFVFTRTADYVALCILLFVVLVWIDANLTASKFGRSIRAAATNEQVAASRGIDARRALLLAFMVSGAMAGVSGAMLGHLLQFVGANTFTYEGLGLPIVAIVAVGGAGSRAGVTLAALAYVFVPQAIPALRGWQPVLVALGLIYVVSGSPGGGAGMVRSIRTRRRADGARPISRFAAPAKIPAQLAAPPALEVSELSVRRDDERVLDSISLRVEPASIVGIVGPNGAGKTTLLDAISGSVLSEGGTITVGDLDIVSLPARARASLGLARTFEKLGLVGELSLEENLLLAQQHSLPYGVIAALARSPSVGRAEAQARERAAAAAAACGVADMLAVRTRELSFGQQRLAELACAIASGAGVLLLDEPSAGLGSQARAAVSDLISHLRGRHTILLVEHDLALAAAVSDQLCVLEDGRIVALGSPNEIALPASLTPTERIP